MTKGPRRHKETWWWNEEVAETVREKKIKYGKWKKENTKEARMEYKKSRNKKLSYRRGTARCVVSIEILPVATQQCRNYLDDKS